MHTFSRWADPCPCSQVIPKHEHSLHTCTGTLMCTHAAHWLIHAEVQYTHTEIHDICIQGQSVSCPETWHTHTATMLRLMPRDPDREQQLSPTST